MAGLFKKSGARYVPRGQAYTGKDFRFATRGDVLYAIAMARPGEQAVITSLAAGRAPGWKVGSVSLLGHRGALEFSQDETGLKVKLPPDKPCEFAYALKITRIR